MVGAVKETGAQVIQVFIAAGCFLIISPQLMLENLCEYFVAFMK